MADTTAVIRPSAVLTAELAAEVIRELEMRDVSRGGLWSATAGLWQRYDHAWDGPGGNHGTAKLVGTIGAVYGTPSKYDITIYRVTVTEHGIKQGWSVESLCDDALKFVGLTLATCPRTELAGAKKDPFYKGDGSGTDAPAR
ncbi:MAG TPA: hypothetical protein VMZ11_06960 [Mycobacteriales bacterium]|nr:hypothetical protein [Mycobacteriales bacterium]